MQAIVMTPGTGRQRNSGGSNQRSGGIIRAHADAGSVRSGAIKRGAVNGCACSRSIIRKCSAKGIAEQRSRTRGPWRQFVKGQEATSALNLRGRREPMGRAMGNTVKMQCMKKN